ncbi:uncharacterized protein Z519_00439 [Cladophialophora bantiana CBS 173.52]|uniref:Zn(2)-C6 fungal-type domain-containing protein n=1 Tax=Cladophialophora bantiana (strain ATCC 10958 / CBS 173.52 / CDC B-1940 / NIH 8579) TaxID=1442370 RepID=A0A0D2F9L5_CLAB1|nr:uncharacterized protein Z519_00439 [Cladophialophora bantiana CBS 173.52]KIW98776.1 hypothetical protein Z519_00439 [Cladophialophora bantiana CBS 173.52]
MLGADTERLHEAIGHSEGRVGQFPPPRRSRAKDPAARKRAVYVEQACVFCKARKIRCDGQLPCVPCQRRSSNCRYSKVHSEARGSINGQSSATPESPVSGTPNQVGLAELTDIVSRLQTKIAILERQQHESRSEKTTQNHGNLIEHDVQNTTHAPSPAFAGPTSADFSFGVAGIILQQERGASNGRPWLHAELTGSVNSDEEGENSCNLPLNETPSPLYGLQLQDALRLIQLYHESIEILHPVVDSKSLQQLATSLFQGVDYAADRIASSSCSPSSFLSADVDIAHLKMVVAISLLAESGGFNPVARKIHDDLIPVITNHILAKTFTLGGQILLLLTAFYHIFQDDSRLASRYVVIASRIMVEAGLHLKNVRRNHLASDTENARVLVVLWTCMYLDRQLNFNAGLPFGLNDSDIEIPEMEKMPAYLKAMTAYMRMGPRAWNAMTDERGQLKCTISKEDFEFIDFQVQRWEESLPKELRILRHQPLVDRNDPVKPPDRGTQLLRFILYLRANQFKIVLMRPLLFSTQTFQQNIQQVMHMTQFANDNIEMIVTADKTCGLYAKQQPLFNLFLSSALSTLLLIYVHSLPGHGMVASHDDLPETVRTAQFGINNGLELLRSYSLSRSSQRLSKKITSLLQCLGFSLLASDNQTTGATKAPSSSSSEGSQPVTISPQPPREGCLSQDFSGWHSLLPDDGLTSGAILQHQVSNNQAFAVSELDQVAFWNGKNSFDNDILLTFMNEFSG